MGLDRHDRPADAPDDEMEGAENEDEDEDEDEDEFDGATEDEGSDEPSGWSEAEITTDEDIERDSWTRKKLRDLRRSVG